MEISGSTLFGGGRDNRLIGALNMHDLLRAGSLMPRAYRKKCWRPAAVSVWSFRRGRRLTDSSFLRSGGREYKSFHARDGHGIKLLRERVATAVISDRRSQSVAAHEAEFAIFRGRKQTEAFDQLRLELALAPDEIAHVGDDLLDLPIMPGRMAVAVADAHFSIHSTPTGSLPTRRSGRRAKSAISSWLKNPAKA